MSETHKSIVLDRVYNDERSRPILCPVPCEHLKSVFDHHRESGPVAFGSQKRTFFVDKNGPRRNPGIAVYLYVTKSAYGPDQFEGAKDLWGRGFITYEAKFIEWLDANDEGVWRDERSEHFRPRSTKPDTPFKDFWVVEDIRPTTPIWIKGPVRGPRRFAPTAQSCCCDGRPLLLVRRTIYPPKRTARRVHRHRQILAVTAARLRAVHRERDQIGSSFSIV